MSSPEPNPVTSPEPAAPPAAPKVVTRTRRRSASRPAGPPTSAASDAGVPSLAEAQPHPGSGSPAADGLVEPGTVGVEPGAGGAGPTDDSDDGHPELHVPIKKKGSRKR